MKRLLLIWGSIVMLPLVCLAKQKGGDFQFRENTMIRSYSETPTGKKGTIIIFHKEEAGRARKIVYGYTISHDKSGFTCTKDLETLAPIQEFSKIESLDKFMTSDEFNTESQFCGDRYRHFFSPDFFEKSNLERIAIFDSISNANSTCIDTVIRREYVYREN